jgi:tRNA (guanosine-2'-O-)-methyltransferase
MNTIATGTQAGEDKQVGFGLVKNKSMKWFFMLFYVQKSVLFYSTHLSNFVCMTPERKEKLLDVLSKRQAGLSVVMENVDDPHNISAVMRTCEAVGIQDIFVLTTKIHPHKKFGPRSSSSAAKWLTIHQYTDAKECFAELRKRYDQIFTTHLGTDSIGLYEIDFAKSTALVFGNEHDGVSEEIRSMADGNFIIPQMGIIQSLNISVACAVSIYEALRQKKVAGHYDQSSLSAEKIDELMKHWGLPRKRYAKREE